jgi:hypothetical protein
MKETPTRAEKSAKTKQRIYERAIELFRKNGFENVTMHLPFFQGQRFYCTAHENSNRFPVSGLL